MTALPHEKDDTEVPVRATIDLVWRLAELHDPGKVAVEFSGMPLGKARKVSVSLPEELTAAVQERVGKGEFSQYVASAVARQLELDLLAELAETLEAEHGRVPEEYLAEAAAAWPDGE
ncbi:hypothetical protein KIPE111705_13775 [Kibdelosporangium persicum]|uniref:Uncharacterized protein n=1 Tax=Kibdelosporangium persicum TaxID=2698649 RepID=A0ABX2F9N7_9PSEU|nr:hypothetical protein [Kibdelosporangium persicum]NRN68079.1 hypothetical protein [Kibdelosporangium persicum]